MCTHTTMFEYMLVAGVIVYFFIHGVLVEKCKVLDVFKRYELWSWFVVKTLFQFLHVCMREGYRDRQREGGWDRGGGWERWCVEERRHRMWDTTESSAALCYLSKILYSTLTTMIFFNSVFFRCISQTRGLCHALCSKSDSGTAASSSFYLFSSSFSSCFSP